VNRKNLKVGEVNFAPGFVDPGADVSSGQQHLPAFLFAQFGDVRSMMIAVPGVEE
jgi:hypothetical protein